MELMLVDNELRLGQHLLFGANGSKLAFGPGWSGPEPQFCWTDGVVAQLRFLLPPTVTPLQLTLECEPKIRNDEPTHVLFALDGRICREERMWGRSKVSLPIEANTSTANLALIVPSAITPANLLADPPDYRHLGLCVYEVGLEER